MSDTPETDAFMTTPSQRKTNIPHTALHLNRFAKNWNESATRRGRKSNAKQNAFVS